MGMQLLVLCIFSLPWSAAVQYTQFHAEDENGLECSACVPTDKVTQVEEIKSCLSKVPASCQYTLQVSGYSGEAELCADGLGVSFAAVMGDFADSGILTNLTGFADAALKTEWQGDCQLEYQTSQTEFCNFQPGEVGVSLLFSDGFSHVFMEYTRLPAKYMNFYADRSLGNCGIGVSTFYMENVGCSLRLSGAKDPQASTAAPASPIANGGSGRLLSVALAIPLYAALD